MFAPHGTHYSAKALSGAYNETRFADPPASDAPLLFFGLQLAPQYGNGT